MKMNALLSQCDVTNVTGQCDREVVNIAYHTDAVRTGSLFVALRGAKTDGHMLIPRAIAAGASVIVAEEAVAPIGDATVVRVPDTRVALGQMAAQWFAHPTREMALIGITGTNGKTTITYLLESIWRAAGMSPGVMGTVNYRFGERVLTAPTTTPESYEVQSICREMRAVGVDAVAMEVSSHGLSQYRVNGCHFDGAVFTNLSQDHLDYHGDMQSYADAKRRLFVEVLAESQKTNRFAVMNTEEAVARELVAGCDYPIFWYGCSPDADIGAKEWTVDLHGLQCQVSTPAGTYPLRSHLIGRFNLLNVLAACGVAHAMGVDPKAVQQGVAALTHVPGRLQRCTDDVSRTVFVDYAHTPAALENVVQTLRPLAKGRLITVFGCGGDRDQGKRSLMGAAAARGSDYVIVTSDNPRTENPHTIIEQIMPGVKLNARHTEGDTRVGAHHEIIVDRLEAIERALTLAQVGDVVLIAGKGHEDYQIIGTEKRHLDDREIVSAYISRQSSVASRR